MLQLDVCYSWMYVTATCMLQLDVCNSYMYVTVTCILYLHDYICVTCTGLLQLHQQTYDLWADDDNKILDEHYAVVTKKKPVKVMSAGLH